MHDDVPFLIVEVLSPADSHAELMRKFADYARLSIPHIWLVDPIAKQLSIYRDGSLIATPRLELPDHSFAITACEVFEA